MSISSFFRGAKLGAQAGSILTRYGVGPQELGPGIGGIFGELSRKIGAVQPNATGADLAAVFLRTLVSLGNRNNETVAHLTAAQAYAIAVALQHIETSPCGYLMLLRIDELDRRAA